jgi:taurine dioxygenase
MKTRLLEPFGIEVDIDLGQPVADDVAIRLGEMFHENRLLVFRGQSLDREQQRRAAGLFGRVPGTENDTPFISNMIENALGSAELSFHSDDEYCDEPLVGISLHAITVDDGSSCTRFADGVGAWRRLPAALKQRVENLTARHAVSADGSVRSRPDLPDPRWPHAVHPVVKRHPVTGEQVLYVTAFQTNAILGLAGEDSEALLQELFGYLYAPDNVLEHYWSRGDLLIWDNLALQHARGDIGTDVERTLQRVSIGTTMLEQMPEFRKEFAEMAATILNKGASSPY